MNILASTALKKVTRQLTAHFGSEYADQLRIAIEERIAETITNEPVDSGYFQQELNSSLYPYFVSYQVLHRENISDETIIDLINAAIFDEE